MRTEPDKGLVNVKATLGRSEGAMPLGRIGSGLALIYHDVMTAPLPPDLQRLVDRLESGDPSGESDGQAPAE